MIQSDRPIYDRMVERFFFLPTPAEGSQMNDKLTRLLGSYEFLVKEYQRVLSHGLLANAIARFRCSFGVGNEFSDVKVIDSLIWKFISFAEKDALRERKIIYQ